MPITGLSEPEMLLAIREHLKTETAYALCKRTGMSRGVLSAVLAGSRPVPEQVCTALKFVRRVCFIDMRPTPKEPT